ncbi:hypothetical protein ACIPF8_05705 [Collimonas sp. NPDC087041]|uniref:hypothetical protein n=1 Tax=Collimonas sp. NPDC087041 TaxID=3363960 RepID=UPI003827CF04
MQMFPKYIIRRNVNRIYDRSMSSATKSAKSDRLVAACINLAQVNLRVCRLTPQVQNQTLYWDHNWRNEQGPERIKICEKFYSQVEE